ncbi:MAG: hypothetical protein ACI8X5_003257 [Planctomycetota bacterium]|jgi:hypothetical protein
MVGTERGTPRGTVSATVGVMAPRVQLIRAILRLILLAALVSAPIFLVAEQFDGKHVLLVLSSNGVCALLCWVLLWKVKQGQVEMSARILVYGLLLLIGWLATTNGEGVHVNVVNFLLVTVLASVLLGRQALFRVSLLSSLTMIWIACQQTVAKEGEGLAEARLESIVQFFPTYLVIVAVLWLSAENEHST